MFSMGHEHPPPMAAVVFPRAMEPGIWEHEDRRSKELLLAFHTCYHREY